MDDLKQPPPDTEIFSLPEKAKRNLKFAPIGFFGYSAIVGWKIWQIYQAVGPSPKLISLLVMNSALVVFFMFLIFFRRGVFQRKFEMSSAGFSQVEGNGESKTITWDELDRLVEPMSGTSLTLVDKTGKKRIEISPLKMDGFDRVKKRIYAEYDKRHPKNDTKTESDVYAMASSVKRSFLILGIFFLMMFGMSILAVIGLALNPGHPTAHPLGLQVFGGLAGLFCLAVAFYGLVYGPKISKSKIEITGNGIARLERDGSKVFIRWEDMGKLRKRERMKQIGIYDIFNHKKIMVDFQFERFDQIRDRIYFEYEKRFTLPALPALYGRLPATPNPGFLIFIFSFIGFLTWIWARQGFQQTGSFGLVIAMFLGMYIFFLRAEADQVKALTLDDQGAVLHKLFGKVTLSWKQIKGVDQETIATQHGRFFVVKITASDEKTYSLANNLGSRLRFIFPSGSF